MNCQVNNAVDFIGIQSIRIFADEIYQYVKDNKDELSGVYRGGSRPQQEIDEQRELYKSLLDELPLNIQISVKNLMTRMFPRWDNVFGGVSYGSDWLSNWRRKRRICSPDVFDVYFRLSIFSGDISAIEMRTILGKGESRDGFAKELLRLSDEIRSDGTNRLELFFEQMEDYTEDSIPFENIEPIIGALYKVGDQVTKDKDKKGMFDFGIDMKIMRVSRQLVKRLPSQEERFELLSKVFSTGNAISTIVERVIISGQEHGRLSQNGPYSPEKERLVSEKHQDKLEEIALERIREVMREKKLHLLPKLSQAFFALSNWGDKKEARQYVKELIQDDQGLCYFIEGYLRASYSHGLDDRIAKKTWRIGIEQISTLLDRDPEDLLSRCAKLLSETPDWLTDRQRIALVTLIKEIREPRDSFGEPIQ